MIYFGNTTFYELNTIKARLGSVYYTTDTNEFYIFTTDKTWAKLADNTIMSELSKRRYIDKRHKCPSCGATHKETEKQCYWCGHDFTSEDDYE